MTVLRWVAALTLGQIAKALFWSVVGPCLVAAGLSLLVTWYLPVTLVSLAHNRMGFRSKWTPYW